MASRAPRGYVQPSHAADSDFEGGGRAVMNERPVDVQYREATEPQREFESLRRINLQQNISVRGAAG